MSPLHPTARALLEAIAEKARAQTTPTRYVSMWTALNQEADACDIAFTAWERVGFPIAAPPAEPSELEQAEACPFNEFGDACIRQPGHKGGHHYIHALSREGPHDLFAEMADNAERSNAARLDTHERLLNAIHDRLAALEKT